MGSVNKVILVGNLGKDPELRTTQSGKSYCKFSLATSESYTTQAGERRDNTEWHNIVVWGKQAEACSRFLQKGRSAYVEGRIQYRSWDGDDGQKRYITEINASKVVFLGGGGQTRDASPGTRRDPQGPVYGERQEQPPIQPPLMGSDDNDIPF